MPCKHFIKGSQKRLHVDTSSFRAGRTTVIVALVAVLKATLLLVQEHSPMWCLGELRTYWVVAIVWGGILGFFFCRSKKSPIGLITTYNCIVASLRILTSFKAYSKTIPLSLTVRKPHLPSLKMQNRVLLHCSRLPG